MPEEITTEIKPGESLTDEETIQIDTAKAREWETPPITEAEKKLCTFVFIKDEDGKILAQGQLIPTEITFNDKTYPILGIGGIIANVKGQGLGRKLMEEIKQYLIQNNITGIGFTGDEIISFYRKCGFLGDKPSLKRFVHVDGKFRNTNTTEDWVFYLDSKDILMEQALQKPEQDILVARDPDW